MRVCRFCEMKPMKIAAMLMVLGLSTLIKQLRRSSMTPNVRGLAFRKAKFVVAFQNVQVVASIVAIRSLVTVDKFHAPRRR